MRLPHDQFVSGAVDTLRRLLQLGQAVDVREAESDKSEAAHELLLQAIAPLLEDAHAIIRSVAARFEEAAEDDPGRLDVADIAALAGMALHERRAFLTHAQPCDHWTFLENCERSLRSLGKSASVVEAALTRYALLPPFTDRATNLAASLRVRRRYATLRREVARVAAEQLDIRSRLDAVRKSISALLACDEYRSMRLGDRRELRMLQFRIQSWLSSEITSTIDGERTWEEVNAVVSLLVGVNQRSELVLHDAEMLAALATTAAKTTDVRTLRESAAPLFGFDAELDALLELQAPEAGDSDRWRFTIARLAWRDTFDIQPERAHEARSQS